MQKNKKYSNLTPAEIAKLKKALSIGAKSTKKEIVKPSKSMMMDTTTGMGANIFIIPKKKPNKKKSGTNKNKKKN